MNWKTIKAIVLLFVLWSTVLAVLTRGIAASDQIVNTEEFMGKAVFLQKFAQFINWPEESNISDLSKPFIIGIIGSEEMRRELTEIYSKVKIKKKRVEVIMINGADEIPKCQLLYILKPEKVDFKEVLNVANKNPVLTVSSDKGYAQKGIHISMYKKREKVKFEVNQGAIKKSPLSAAYILYSSATKVVNRVRRR
jgi:YfiR/HmsC-like